MAKSGYRLPGRTTCGVILGKHVYPVTLDFASTPFRAHEELHCLLMSRDDKLEHYMVLREIDTLHAVYNRIGGCQRESSTKAMSMEFQLRR